MRQFQKPTLAVSKCLGFESCRYNGLIISSEIVEKLKPFVEYIPVCPEVEIGLGIPRDPIRLVGTNDEKRLIQPSTSRDVTDKMVQFTETFFSTLPEIDGWILKNRSPSCGFMDVKLYPAADSRGSQKRTSGMFGGMVLERFSQLPVEDEGRLTNFRIREHFLTRLFLLREFREVKKSRKMGELVRFQSENKLLLMGYNQKGMRILGRIVANPIHLPFENVIADYESNLQAAFARPPRAASSINVLMHAMGYFSKRLSHEEKSYFLDTLQSYRIGKIPLSVPSSIIRAWIIRFDEAYLEPQTFFEPYPESLMEITDSGKGRNL